MSQYLSRLIASSKPRNQLPSEDFELLLPSHNGQTHKRFKTVTHSISYLFISGASAFALTMMIWLGPGLIDHDPKGMNSQSNAHVGYLDSLYADNSTNSTGSTIPISSTVKTNSSRPKLSVDISQLNQLPSHPWNPLLYDPAPITHVYVKPCMFPPWAFKSFCTPHQTVREIALYGEWVRVPRDLSKGIGHYYTEIYYRRAQTLDLSSLDVEPITDLKIWEEDQVEDPKIKSELKEFGWEPAGEGIRTGIWPTKVKSARIYFTRSTKIKKHPISEINVLWSPKTPLTAPWWGFERLNQPVIDGDNSIDHIQCDVVVRRRIVRPPPPPSLTFQKDGKFRIMQISDLHFSASGGKCRLTRDFLSSTSKSISTCKERGGADVTTMEWLSAAIANAKPHLIVLTGDQLLGADNTFDTISTLTKLGHFFVNKKVPWTIVFGNHDSDKSLAIEEQMYLLKHMPLFLGRAGPGVPGFEEEHNPGSPSNQLSDMGVGNYVLKINASPSDATQLLSLYFLDSHSYPMTTFSELWELAMGGKAKYDWIKKSQIEWYMKESNAQPILKRPYRPSASSNLEPEFNSHRETKPIGLMFFHIPLPEAYGSADLNPVSHAELLFGNQKEKPLPAEVGDHFFDKALLETSIFNTTTSSFEPEVKVIANGHAHMTDTCRRHKGIYHCFSGLSSYSGKVSSESHGWERRVRVFDVEEFGEKISTFQLKHVIDDDKPNHLVKFEQLVLFDSSLSINSTSST